MSADRWSVCPRCKHEQWAHLVARREEVESSYGKAPSDEFIERLREVQTDLEAFAPNPTFREDWEFYGAGADYDDGGILHVRYTGACNVCGLSVQFEHDKLFYAKGQDPS